MKELIMSEFDFSSDEEFLLYFLLLVGFVSGILIGFLLSLLIDIFSSYQLRNRVKFLEKYILTNKPDPEEKE